MLDLMLGNAPDAFSCGEVSAWFRPWRHHHFQIDCPCGQNPCPVWERIKSARQQEFHATVIRELGVDFVIDSSKDLSWLVDVQGWAAAQGIKTYNLLIWKDPVRLAYSFWKRGKNLGHWRSEFVIYHRRFLQLGLPFLAVNYNELVSKPPSTLAALCAAVGMTYYDGKEHFWEKQHHHLFGSGGVRQQVESGKSILEIPESYPREFELQIDGLRSQIGADSEVQELLETFKQADVFLRTKDADGEGRFVPKRPYPLWYYRRRMIGLVRRYFPKRYDAALGEQVETVPIRRQ